METSTIKISVSLTGTGRCFELFSQEQFFWVRNNGGEIDFFHPYNDAMIEGASYGIGILGKSVDNGGMIIRIGG